MDFNWILLSVTGARDGRNLRRSICSIYIRTCDGRVRQADTRDSGKPTGGPASGETRIGGLGVAAGCRDYR